MGRRPRGDVPKLVRRESNVHPTRIRRVSVVDPTYTVSQIAAQGLQDVPHNVEARRVPTF
eukprot:4503269-Pyramimonas_sp.AAC.1